ncbi:MAG: ATP-binding protein [Planctomycetota bacterium]|jgi:CO dehydrogenase maturation factor
MSYTIAITGKGGVGKTTLSGLIITRLIHAERTPILAVDADPNTCLDEVLGVKSEKSIGSVREEAREIAGKGMAAGISKQDLLEMKIAESLVEADAFDLIAMGRPEGPGCYCYANNVLKAAIGEIAHNYPYVVIDNEAGLENLSRRIVQKVDLLILVADPSKRGITTMERLYELANEMEVDYDRLALVVNRARNGNAPAGLDDLQTKTQADFALVLPDDEELARLAEEGTPMQTLTAENAVARKLDGLLNEINLATAS